MRTAKQTATDRPDPTPASENLPKCRRHNALRPGTPHDESQLQERTPLRPLDSWFQSTPREPWASGSWDGRLSAAGLVEVVVVLCLLPACVVVVLVVPPVALMWRVVVALALGVLGLWWAAEDVWGAATAAAEGRAVGAAGARERGGVA